MRDAFTLTPAERRIAQLVARGLTNKKIAADLGISTETVKTHVSTILSKLGVGSRRDLAVGYDEATGQYSKSERASV